MVLESDPELASSLAQATGGQTFYVDSAKNLEAVYRQINDDLRRFKALLEAG